MDLCCFTQCGWTLNLMGYPWTLMLNVLHNNLIIYFIFFPFANTAFINENEKKL